MPAKLPTKLLSADVPGKTPAQLPFMSGDDSGGGGSVIILQDTFTDAGGTNIELHTPDTVESPASGPWADAGLNFIIDTATGTELHRSGDANDTFAFIDSGISDLIIYTSGMWANSGLVFRYTDSSNYWMLFRNSSGAGEILYERTSGSYINRGSSSVGGGVAYVDWAVLANGSSITAYSGGTSRITYGSASSHLTSTLVGFQREITGTEVALDITVKNSTDTAELP